MDANMPKMHLTSAEGETSISNHGEAFVDDSYLGCTSTYQPSSSDSPSDSYSGHATSAIRHLTEKSQAWERLLFTTGGALNLNKSHWFLMHWQWINGATILDPIDHDRQLLLTAGFDQTLIPVSQISPFDSYKTLGAYLSPSGSSTKAIEVLRSKAENYASHVTGSSLNREEAYWSYILYFIQKVGFSLPAMTFMEEKCNFIQSPAVNAVLPKLHLNQHTARSIIFGPSEYGGLNLPNLYCSQGIGQLHLFLGHLGEQDESGRLILLSMSYVQLIIGSGESFLHKPFPKYERWLDHNWLTSLWCFISKIKLKITVKRQWKPSLPRENDVFLMDSFVTHGYKKVELQLLNQCR